MQKLYSFHLAFFAVLVMFITVFLTDRGYSISKMSVTNQKLIIEDLVYFESEYLPGMTVNSKFDDGIFKPYHGKPFSTVPKNKKVMITLKGQFLLEEALSTTPLALYFGPSNYPYSVYLNKHLILQRGSREGEYRSNYFTSINYQLLGQNINFGSVPNELVIELYPLFETAPFDFPFVAQEKLVTDFIFARDLFNVNLIRSVCVLCFFIGLYFVFRFISRKFADKHYIYFALLCFTFSISYFNIVFHMDGYHEILFEKIVRSAFAIDTMFLTLFVREFTGVGKKKRWLVWAIVVPSVIMASFTWSLDSKEAILNYFKNVISNAVITPCLLLSISFLITAYIRKKKLEFLIILSAFVPLIIFSLRDLGYFNSGLIPFCWVLPYGYLILLISIFVVLAMEESILYKESIRKAEEIEKKNKSLQDVLNKMELVSHNLVQSGVTFEENIITAIQVVDDSNKNSRQLSSRMLDEMAVIEKLTRQISNRISTAGERIPKAIISQTGIVQETNQTIEKLYTGIEKIMDSTLKTNTVAQELSRMAEESKTKVLQSQESMAKINEYSQFIADILEQIEDIVEDSKTLSINAAIESARAGEAGKGFGVVALEIRELATRSKESLEESQEKLKQMTSYINLGQAQSDQVTSLLLTIIEKAGHSAKMVEGISSSMNQQKTESKSIQEGARRLLTDTESIHELSVNEQKESEGIKQTLSSLKTSLEDMTALLQTQSISESAVHDAMDKMRNVLEQNKTNSTILEETIELARSQ